MARIEVMMPQMGESIAEGTIVKWHKKVGDAVRKDETLLEISTDKVDSEIPAPASGVLAEIAVEENKTVAVRTVIGFIETDADGAGPAPPAAAAHKQEETPKKAVEPQPQQEKPAQPAPGVDKAPSPEPAPSVAEETPAGGRFYSPLVMNIARTEGLPVGELEKVPGTGEGGRLTKKDLLAYLEKRKSAQAPPPAAAPPPATAPANRTPAAAPVESSDLASKYPSPQHEILQMSNVLQKMAHHMVASVQTSPHVAAIHEVDMTAIVKHRAGYGGEFEEREGFKLTYTPYIIDAVVRTIKKYPLINCSVEGDKIIKKNYINLGIAVASENGLIVPVIKHAEEKNFLGYARAVNDLARRTRSKKLTPDEIQGGTFTITNYGVFGTMIGTPIINQPQVAILGTGAIKKRVAVVDDALAIRSIAYFTLSFDHRVVDGALGGMFMDDLVKNLESFAGTTEG